MGFIVLSRNGPTFFEVLCILIGFDSYDRFNASYAGLNL